jgi:hypothetical protein
MKENLLRLFVFSFVWFILTASADASGIPERRKTQFSTDFGYAIFPYPYSLPGIGTGLGLVGGAMNMKETTTDAYAMLFGGEVQGLAAGVADLHIIPRHLILDLGYSGISAAAMQSYGKRGMNTEKNDYVNIELGDMTYYGSRLTATFADRRFELYGAYYQGSSRLESIRYKDGTIITESATSPVSRGHVTILGTRVDLTDDYYDPRRGVRLDITRSHTPPDDSGPDYFIQDYNATAYVPLGRRSTWAFNFFRSDAHVDRKGETDLADITEDTGLYCNSILNPEERKSCEDHVNSYINSIIDGNNYGTASSLGGFNRLRSYPAMRYKGAHTIFYGTEIRWNLTDEATPFNIFVMKDVRTSWQIALYYEMGSVADKRTELGDVWRASTGIGLRMVTASGVVFRADVATGREGVAPSIFIGYPWDLQ